MRTKGPVFVLCLLSSISLVILSFILWNIKNIDIKKYTYSSWWSKKCSGENPLQHRIKREYKKFGERKQFGKKFKYLCCWGLNFQLNANCHIIPLRYD